jgi:hypothetical protein
MRDGFDCTADQTVSFRSFRAETFYQPAAELQTHEEIASARSSITRNSKRPHAKAMEPECLIRPYSPLINSCDTVCSGEGKGKSIYHNFEDASLILAILQTVISKALIRSPGEIKIWEPRTPALIEIKGNLIALSSKKRG